MKRMLLLMVALAISGWAQVDLSKPVPEIQLVNGEVLKEVQFVSFGKSTATARWKGNRGTIRYTLLPDAVAAAILRKLASDEPATVAPAASPPKLVEGASLKMGKIGLQAVEESGGYTYYAWKVDVKNEGNRTGASRIKIRLLDKEKFLLEEDHGEVAVGAGKTETATGKSLMKSAVWTQVSSYEIILVD